MSLLSVAPHTALLLLEEADFSGWPSADPHAATAGCNRHSLITGQANFTAAVFCALRSLQADISHLVSSRLSLLLEEDLNDIAAAIARLRELLPFKLVDKFVEAHPQVLDVQDFEQAVEVGLEQRSNLCTQ